MCGSSSILLSCAVRCPNEVEYIAFCSADRSARATTTAITMFGGEVISLGRFATNAETSA